MGRFKNQEPPRSSSGSAKVRRVVPHGARAVDACTQPVLSAAKAPDDAGKRCRAVCNNDPFAKPELGASSVGLGATRCYYTAAALAIFAGVPSQRGSLALQQRRGVGEVQTTCVQASSAQFVCVLFPILCYVDTIQHHSDFADLLCALASLRETVFCSAPIHPPPPI